MKVIEKDEKKTVSEFAEDVLSGLNGIPKMLPSKYLYDDEGYRLFEEITDLPEYYLSKSEFEIIRNSKIEIFNYLNLKEGQELFLIDLGAGNTSKSFMLIHYFSVRSSLKYFPIDLSKSALENGIENLKCRIPEIKVKGIHADYFNGLRKLQKHKDVCKLVLFLGSNIGNIEIKDNIKFLKSLRKSLNPEDLVLIGFDLKKNPALIRAAYNDSKMITSRFNFNILKRINHELGGEFDLKKFMFYPAYDPQTGEVKNYLISKEDQNVFIKNLDRSFHFGEWETVLTACSNKYTQESIANLANKAGFRLVNNFYDSNHYFNDSLWIVE